ncbi:PRAME family member 8-like [Apodemus sylvaticus]|uniref:PRAME family member 8-like n=1 Tax=Apodemus sylvaticus TaxID=10129 RepID=UPI00224458F8|nr:PRAME family member 8-like [Apodemus sylvaticus]
MSTYNPPTLQQLALDALLRNDAIDSFDLDHLPTMLFPPLFLEAFNGRHTEILKAMVAAWPFSYLPLGPLLKTNDVEMLQAVLDGIDILLTQTVLPRKLQVLDLRVVHQDFWDAWAEKEDSVCSADVLIKKQVPDYNLGYPLRQCFQVVTNLALFFSLNKHQTCLLQWAQERKDSLQLCCLKMKICDFPLEIIREVFNMFQPKYIEELEINTNQVMYFLSFFGHFLGEMRNLLKFHLHQTHFNFSLMNTVKDVKMCAAQFFSQFSKLNHLQHLYVNGAHFSYDNMKELFRCLKNPLESLSMVFCHLSVSDLKHMSECQRLYQLKHLHFYGVLFSESCFKRLQILLENISETLQTLQIENCRMTDSQLKVLLPTLIHCSQLTLVNFYDNDFSTPVLKDLLQCMANLSKLTVERYPAPLECYNDMGNVVAERFSQVCRELKDILMAKRQHKTLFFATVPCTHCWMRCVYDMKTRLCHCWQERGD